jgi:hypothetical protein
MKRLAWIIGISWIAGLQLASGQVIGSMGLKAGVSLSNQAYRFTPIDYAMETEAILGPSLAFFAEAFRGEHFSMQADLAFACRGSATSTQSVTVNHLDNDRVVVNEGDRTTSRFRYFSIAPMLRARTGQNRFMPYALFGPRLDMLLYYSTDSEYPLDEQNNLILGLAMGIGVEFTPNSTGFFGELQYQPDLSPVTTQEPLQVNNNSLVFTLGIRWNKAP